MYISMTGFGRAQREEEWGTVNAELSSVNHRYQEISVRLPREFSSLEPWFHQQLRKMFRRGKVQLRIEVTFADSAARGTINKDLLTSYCRDISEVRRSLHMMPEVNVEQAAMLPGVIDMPVFAREEEEIEAVFAAVLDDVVSKWQEMRKTEGKHLKDEVMTHLNDFERIANDIEAHWQPTRDAAFAAMKEHVEETLQSLGESLEEGRYMQEIVLLTDKWDVAEELARIKSHIAKFRATGDDAESSGRKLDFLIQELNREVSTLDSKVADARIRWLAVDAKAALERIREQIQNLE